MLKQVEIISATECKSLNPYGFVNNNTGSSFESESQVSHSDLWQQAEIERKVYKVCGSRPDWSIGESSKYMYTTWLTTGTRRFEIGSIHEAEVNENDLTATIL